MIRVCPLFSYKLILDNQGHSIRSRAMIALITLMIHILHIDDDGGSRVWWLLVVIGWKHWVMDHDGVGSRPRVMEQVLTMNVIPYNESHKTDLPSASFVRSPNCRDGTFIVAAE